MSSKFIEVFNEVFDNDLNVQKCGREKCKELILLARELDKTKDFGSIETGFMNIEELKNLKESIVPKRD